MRESIIKYSSFGLVASIILFFNSCSTYHPPVPDEYYEAGLVDFAYDIAENPDKMYDLKKHYPQYYDEDYLYVTLKESELKRNIGIIKEKFCDIPGTITLGKMDFYEVHIESMNSVAGTDFNFKRESLYGLALHKDEHRIALIFLFVKTQDQKFNIFLIKKETHFP